MENTQTLLDLEQDQDQINQTSEALSSGVKFSSPSDDPYAWAQSMNAQQGIREYTSIQSNLTFATGWEKATSSALTQLSDLVSQAEQVAISATSASGTNNGDSYATEVNSILQQALNLANTQYGTQYIFAGSATSQIPFSIDSSTGAVTYNGDPNSVNMRTDIGNGSNNNTTTINVSGSDLFTFTSGGQSLNVLNQLWQLKEALTNGDSSTVSNSITTLGDAFDHINDESAIVGTSLSELTTQQSAISVFQTNDQSNLSNLEDTDMAQATTQLQQMETAYQAALDVTDKLDNLNLAYYLTGNG
jgi:flagellar hook-associated protein 3 FlgL